MMAPAQEPKRVYGSTILVTFIVIKVVGIIHKNVKKKKNYNHTVRKFVVSVKNKPEERVNDSTPMFRVLPFLVAEREHYVK